MAARSYIFRSRFGEDSGAQIAEFAVSLPLLAVLVVGIFDFGSAFTLKQKLGIVAGEAARVAANQPTSDLTNPASGSCNAPASICAVRDAAESTLVSAKVNDCGLAGAAAASAGTLAWSFTASSGCPGSLQLKIERGLTYTVNLPSPPMPSATETVEATKITIDYPYKWTFSNVITLLVSNANYLPSTISSAAVMQNLN
ncbi:MAG: pilus assembly protein [Acidobacteriales bacterium]|nr:pilus assembly protein [Terriglobales bacterium]